MEFSGILREIAGFEAAAMGILYIRLEDAYIGLSLFCLVV